MNEKTCPTCHASVPANAPGGFCPSCLLRGAEELPAAGHGSPSLEEISAAFPQLEVLGLIGQGGMGFVYQVRQPDLDRMAALKILSPELGKDPAFAERFARESRALGRLNHPNIVTIFEHGQSGGFFYLLMEHVDGVNLRQAMRAGRFTPEQALAIVPGICDALQAAHAQGVWHRDIKPENILLDGQGGVKIADFGIARMAGEREWNFTLTRTGGALGSAAYMAPEQHENPRGVDHRADIYSLGVVIYEMLTGELPLGRFPAPSQRAAVNARIDEIVFRTLEKERELRQQSATEVKTEMLGVGLLPARAEVPAGSSRPERLRKIALVVLLTGMAGYTIWALSISIRMWVFLGGLAILSSLVLGILTWPARWGRVATVLWAMILLAVPAAVVIKPFLGGLRPVPANTTDGVNAETLVDWKTTVSENGVEETVMLKGRLNVSCVSGVRYSAVAVTVGDMDRAPVCMIVSEGRVGSIRRKADGKGLKGSAELGAGAIDYEINGPDSIRIGSDSWDLKAGRVFMCRPGGTVRQIGLFPRNFIPGREIDAFAESIPEEDENRIQHFTPMDESEANLIHDEAYAWAIHRKEGDSHLARGHLSAALASYEAARERISQAQKTNPGSELKEQQADCEERIGDVMNRQGNLMETMKSYLLSTALLKRVLEREPENDRVRDKLVRMLVKLGDNKMMKAGKPTPQERYREAVAAADKLEDGWESAYPLNGGGHPLARDYQPEDVFRLIDSPDRDSWDLMWTIGQAGANKDKRLLPLLERKELLEDEVLALALAGYDYSLNGNAAALESILARLAKQRIGKDVNETVVLSFIDEWDLTIKAVDSHFLATAPGEGNDAQNAFWARRKLLFPRNYLVHLGKIGKEETPDAADPTRWTITEDFTAGQKPRILDLRGKLTPVTVRSGKYAAFTVHSGGDPVFTVAGEGFTTRNSRASEGREMTGNFDIGQQFYYQINDGDSVTINSHPYDLSKGRVFLIRPDKSLRQIAMRSQRLLDEKEELDEFMSSLPPEK